MADKPPFDALLCDLGNVLVNYDHRITAQNLAREIDLDADEIFDRVFESEYNTAFVLGHIDQHEFYSRVRGLFNGYPFPEYETFVSHWVTIFQPNRRMLEAIEDLRGKTRLVLLSNTNVLHFEWISSRFPEVVGPFEDNLILSHEVHAMKPQPEIFERALAFAKTKPSRCLYVDDNIEFINAAKKMGIKGHHYTEHKPFLHAAFPGEYLP